MPGRCCYRHRADGNGYRPAVLRYKATGRYAEVYSNFKEVARIPNPRFDRAIGHRQWYFQPDLALCTQEELDADEGYKRFVYPAGLGWTIGCPVPVPTAEMIVFDFGRTRDIGPFDERKTALFNELRPDLARAAFVASRLGLERARGAVETLSQLGLPAAALTQSGRIVLANDLLTALSPRIGIGAFDRLIADNPALTRKLRSFLSVHSTAAHAAISLPVAPFEDRPPLILHFLPLRQAAADIFSRAQILLVVTPVTAGPGELPQLIAGLFDLTPAEMNLATALVAGQSPPDYARQRGVSHETVRTQLKSLMPKTGTHRQIDLVRLLGGTSLFPKL